MSDVSTVLACKYTKRPQRPIKFYYTGFQGSASASCRDLTSSASRDSACQRDKRIFKLSRKHGQLSVDMQRTSDATRVCVSHAAFFDRNQLNRRRIYIYGRTYEMSRLKKNYRKIIHVLEGFLSRSLLSLLPRRRSRGEMTWPGRLQNFHQFD